MAQCETYRYEHRLQEIAAPRERMNRWTYSYWPTAEVVRKMIDYQQYLTEYKSSDSKESRGISGKAHLS